jgi:hypothetical protein
LFNTHMASRNPKPTFWLDHDGNLQGPTERLEEPLTSSSVAIIALFQRAIGLPWRDKSWERKLPPAYTPLTHYEGVAQAEWQQRWDSNLGRMRDEELDTEKSHLAILFKPRSPRMQYGLALTRAITQGINSMVADHGGQLVVMQTTTDSDVDTGEQVYLLNGRYYRASQKQAKANWQFVNDGFATEYIPVTVPDWRMSREDAHLNKAANEQVMADLAQRLQSLTKAGQISTTNR